MKRTPENDGEFRNGILVQQLTSLAGHAANGFEGVPFQLREVLESGAWQHFRTVHGHELVEYAPGEFERFVTTEPLKGLGTTIQGLINICKAIPCEDSTAAIELLQREHKPLAESRRPTKEEQSNKADDISLKYGTSATYLLRRLKRDNPALAERVMSGVLSANQAALQVGIRKPMLRIPRDPTAAAQRLLREYIPEEWQALKDAIKRLDKTKQHKE
ncbi:MAG: hypothetical protein NVS9B4_00120 [Candidatus Acidiferrum sp.]